MNRSRTKRPILALVVHWTRVAIVAALLLLIPAPVPHAESEPNRRPDLDLIQQLLPTVDSIDPTQNATGLWPLFDETSKPVGTYGRTLPAAKDIVGYRGPSEAAIVFDPELKIVAVRLLSSADTEEYVDAVAADDRFFAQFVGWPWGGPDRTTSIDGVSGATLTSLALAEGVLERIGGNRPSLLFPTAIAVDEVRDWFADAETVDSSATITIVKDKSGRQIGRVLRTGPFSDNIPGYRGPTELLMKLDLQDRVERIKLRDSYDTEPFLTYVRQDADFLPSFEQQTLPDLAVFDPEAAGVDGVTDATMSTVAIADTIVEAARAATAQMESAARSSILETSLFGVRIAGAEIATLLLLGLAGLSSSMHLFRKRLFRKAWLIAVFVIIGLWAGNLVSLALIAGWSGGGMAWQLAPGLAAIAVVASLAPPITGRNSYCNHLCPHGAVQQLIKPSRKARRRIHLSRNVSRWLRRIPALTLVAAYIALVTIPGIDLSGWEPFNAYLFTIAGWGSIIFAAASLLVASVLPMGYCRFGCATGSLLDYFRRSTTSDRLRSGDLVAICLLVFALIYHG